MKVESISKIVIEVNDCNEITVKINDILQDTTNEKEMMLYLDFINQNITLKNTKKAFMRHEK